ncbi:MAG: undecaprenyldiphospho-muramoylpentapeptide beta-N-acetylglucosaminyltransferase [Sulfurospirillum sp.]|nr:undecaprenyldiphospho-muramoylpentapeptide beta-N-acetylglucosaminyltransferase [Sulfurospirillum sp.]
MNIALTGGGTGGHLAIIKAMREELGLRGLKPIYIGSKHGQDRDWFEQDTGFLSSYFLNTKGVVNKKGFKKIAVLVDIFKAVLTCKQIFKLHKIDAVFCVGGYSGAAASIASILLRKPLYIHEQNATIGTLNKLLKPFAKEFFSSYDPRSKVQDYPVSELFFQHKRVRKELQTIIFLGGSQGANFINELAMYNAKNLLDKGVQIIHQTGKGDFERVSQFYSKQGLHVECFAFSKEIIKSIQKADLAISRAGASTLWELCANALPALFIPYPYAANDHQYSNAKSLSNLSLATILRQEELSKKDFMSVIYQIPLEKISQKLLLSIGRNGMKKIVDIILKDDK